MQSPIEIAHYQIQLLSPRSTEYDIMQHHAKSLTQDRSNHNIRAGNGLLPGGTKP